MTTLSEKILRERKRKGMTQGELAKAAGVTTRTIASYETDGRIPHAGTLSRISSALGVTVSYLRDETAGEISPSQEVLYIEKLRNLYGEEMASEVEDLLTKSASLFAGGKLDQEAKDQYFLALTNAYIACKGGKESM